MIGVGRNAMRRATAAFTGLVVLAPLVACTPVSDPSAGMSVADAVALIEKTPRSELTPQAVAEVFALNTKSTDVQREMLEKDLVGHSVEWDLRVYEVASEDGRYKVTSQEIPIKDGDAVPLLRVVAFVLPQDEKDNVLLRSVKTDDVIRIRGIVQEIQLRTIVAVVPGVVVGGPDTNAPKPSIGTT
jgi:hypothetical protein